MKPRKPPPAPAAAPSGESSRRPTMKDVAVLAGVHQTTVSLALRNHPGIPAVTRERIRRIAAEVGYRPDPVLDAFNLHRLASHPLRSAPAIAFISDQPSLTERDTPVAQKELYLGARAMAERMGFVLERFLVGPRQLSAARLNHILVARNIECVVIAACSLQTSELALDWSRLCGLKVESFPLEPALDVITSDHRQGCRRAVSELQALGYRRIGLVLSDYDDRRLVNLARVGYLVESSPDRRTGAIEPFFFDTVAGGDLPRQLGAWIHRHRLDAIVSGANWIPDMLQGGACAVPDQLGFASLDLTGQPASFAGIVPNHRLVGERAVELIAIRRYTYERGVPEHASITFVPVDWRPGASAPGISR